jgi:hypothetical protein
MFLVTKYLLCYQLLGDIVSNIKQGIQEAVIKGNLHIVGPAYILWDDAGCLL